MSVFQDFADITRQEGAYMAAPAFNRWTALDDRFLRLIRQAPPVQKHRVELLHTLAADHDTIEYSEALLTVAEELVSLQRRLERHGLDEFLGEDGVA